MPEPAVVIVGSGQGGLQVAASLRESGHGGPIALVGEEAGLPYQRPPLSKAFLAGQSAKEALWFRPRSFFDKHAIDLLESRRVIAIDREAAVVELDDGERLPFDALVLAAGARPRLLPVPGADLDGVLPLRTVGDAEELAERLGRATNVVVVGGGFIGLEFAAVSHGMGVAVTIIEALPRFMARAVTAEISSFYAREHAGWGATLIFDQGVTRIVGTAGRVTAVETSDGRRHPADLVLVGIGVVPNTDLAERADLDVANGIVVDETLATADPRIFAIGDCAQYPCRFTVGPARLESVQNAVDQGRSVARRIAGAEGVRPYGAVPWFWSDQRDLKLQMAGITAGHDRTIVRGSVADRSFSVFCFRDGRLLGAESVNAPADHMAVRRVLAATGHADAPPLSEEQVRDGGLNLREYARELKVAAH